ncbi:MAG: MerR family transcriptional regulator [Actinomycetota bacterium]
MHVIGGDGYVRIGELAKTAGITVRTLHHYEDIGLLAPEARTEAGHRLYGAADVERLYRVSLLKRLDMSLDQIRTALDDPGWDLGTSLERHAGGLDTEIERLSRVRTAVNGALTRLGDATDADKTAYLLHILEEMVMADTNLRTRISILVYRDIPAAHAHLVDVFGMTPGEITRSPDGAVVHGQVFAGDGEIWLHPETADFGLQAPSTLGAATATMAVMVNDVDDHCRMVAANGADIAYEPVDQPYGYREYSARDPEGTLWSFMTPLDD